jgi:hypothetical protein
MRVFVDFGTGGVSLQHLVDMCLVHYVLGLARREFLAGVDEQDIAPGFIRAALLAGTVESGLRPECLWW